MIKIFNIKSIITWDTDKNCLINLKNKNIYIEKDKIVSISEKDLNVESEIDACNSIITPGFIDCHTHPIYLIIQDQMILNLEHLEKVIMK